MVSIGKPYITTEKDTAYLRVSVQIAQQCLRDRHALVRDADRVRIPMMYLRVGAQETSHVTVGNEWNAEIFADGHVCEKVWDDRGYWVDARKENLFDDSFAVPGIGRVCGRPLFGEMTDWLLEDYSHRRSMEGFQARGSWTVNRDIRKYREQWEITLDLHPPLKKTKT